MEIINKSLRGKVKVKDLTVYFVVIRIKEKRCEGLLGRSDTNVEYKSEGDTPIDVALMVGAEIAKRMEESFRIIWN